MKKTHKRKKRLERRQKEVKPEVDAFFEFVHQFSLEDPLVSEKMKNAINYAGSVCIMV